MAVDTLGHLVATDATTANEWERAQVDAVAKAVQAVTDEHVELACDDRWYTVEEPAKEA